MTDVKYKVPAISCGHCVHTIQMELGDLAGVISAKADEKTKEVAVSFEAPATEEKIISTLKGINYPPEL